MQVRAGKGGIDSSVVKGERPVVVQGACLQAPLPCLLAVVLRQHWG